MHRELTNELQCDFLQLHESLQKSLTDGYNKIGDEIRGSKEDILAKVDRLLSRQDDTANEHQLNLVSGQQDIITTLEKISENILDAHSEERAITAHTMTKLLSEQHDMTQLLTSVSQKQPETKSAQLQQLVRIVHLPRRNRGH